MSRVREVSGWKITKRKLINSKGREILAKRT